MQHPGLESKYVYTYIYTSRCMYVCICAYIFMWPNMNKNVRIYTCVIYTYVSMVFESLKITKCSFFLLFFFFLFFFISRQSWLIVV